MADSLPMSVTAISPAQKMQILNLVRRAARAEILPRFRDLAPAEIDTKSGPLDVVTEADRAAEAMIGRGLLRLFPHALVLGEEAAAADPEIIGRIDDAELGFTIDPVDGTWNFASGVPAFGVMVAATRFGRPVFGLLYDPVMDDVIWADAAGPAELLRRGRPPRRLAASRPGAPETLNGYLNLHFLPRAGQEALAATLPGFARTASLRCACHEFRAFAMGAVDFVLATKVTPWDHAAAVLVAQRAGGHVAFLDGRDYSAGTTDGVLLAAGDRATWEVLRERWGPLSENPA
ncbi:inositol monophosphatase family protein [Roseivivax sp. CAU 1761]